MTPLEFIRKWRAADLSERSAAQQHFLDLCALLGEAKPADVDPTGDWYTFEKGVSKIGGNVGFADVWKRGHFGWEYKKDRANLDQAYQQLLLYSVALENPPLLVVSDTKQFRVYANWTNTVQERHEFSIEDLAKPETLGLLRAVFSDPEKLKPGKTREQVTREAADEFATIAERLRMAGHPAERVAHFLNRLVFCLFAQDVRLLPTNLFIRLLDTLAKRRELVVQRSAPMLSELFGKMRTGGLYGVEDILFFDGGLFDDDTALPLDPDSLEVLRRVAKQDWADIDPTIFGTLFERFLDPDKRAQIGAHYTDFGKIMMIVEPVIIRPLNAEWEQVRAGIASLLAKVDGKRKTAMAKALSLAEARLDVFLARLAAARILDPACGSGNFLYVALQALKDLEHRAIVEAEAMGLHRRVIRCGPENVRGIEINRYAAELARTTIWIGDIQWKRRNGFEAKDEPVLRPIEAIDWRDALISELRDGASVEAEWPAAEFIVGNPPFLGTKKMIRGLGEPYAEKLRATYEGRISRFSDLVCWWFEKARSAILAKQSSRAGLVATNSISGGKNRLVLDRITRDLPIFHAWSDEEWVVEGADVRVSIVCFGELRSDEILLDGKKASNICPDLTPRLPNGRCIVEAQHLTQNDNLAFQGIIARGPFEVSGTLARLWLQQPLNPNGRPNSAVLHPILNGSDISDRRRDAWVVDFSAYTEQEAALFGDIFGAIRDGVIEKRSKARDAAALTTWWKLWRARHELREKVQNLTRYILTPRVSKHRFFVWADKTTLPDDATVAIARDDDTTFGVLQSRFHEAWSLRLGTWLGVGNDPRYTPTTTFETFPFPDGLSPNLPATSYANSPHSQAIARSAKRLDELRNAWLNPLDLVIVEPEVVPGYPDRILPKDEPAAAELKKRTLTNLYNQQPQWLVDAHRELDGAVAAAYAWPSSISQEDALAKLLDLNLARAGPHASKPEPESENSADED